MPSMMPASFRALLHDVQGNPCPAAKVIRPGQLPPTEEELDRPHLLKGWLSDSPSPIDVAASLTAGLERLMNSSVEVERWDRAQLEAYNARAASPTLYQSTIGFRERWDSFGEFMGSGPGFNMLNSMRMGDVVRPLPPTERWLRSYATFGLRADDNTGKLSAAKRGCEWRGCEPRGRVCDGHAAAPACQ